MADLSLPFQVLIGDKVILFDIDISHNVFLFPAKRLHHWYGHHFSKSIVRSIASLVVRAPASCARGCWFKSPKGQIFFFLLHK
jgi:hypothetical protein